MQLFYYPHLSPMLNVGSIAEKESDDLSPSLEAGQSECRVAIRLDLRVDVRAVLQQNARRLLVAVHRGQHQGRDSQLKMSK